MGFYTGRNGSLSISGENPIAKIRDWSLETTVELLDTTDISSTVSTYTPGIKRATGSATLVYYRLSSTESNSFKPFTDLLSKIMKGGGISDADKVTLELNVGGDAKDDIKFDAFITSAQISVSTAELTIVPIQFTMTGDFIEKIEEGNEA